MKFYSTQIFALTAVCLTTPAYAQQASEQCAIDVGSQVLIEAGEFVMGDDVTYREEGPAHKVRVDSFWLDSHEVTNAQFSRFIEETGYVTVAERDPDPEDWPADVPAEFLQAGSTLFTAPAPGQPMSSWWTWSPGTNWRHPEGPQSNIAGRDNYPVVHVAYADALAYANWAGRSLPTEAQFEFAASNGREGLFAWEGDELAPHGHHRANTWQGEFPMHNAGEDAHQGLAPVGCFEANSFGAYDLIGNVWEWTSNWYAGRHAPEDADNPTGPAEEDSFSPAHAGFPVKVIKGGSYLCAENYCLRYRPAARQAQDTGLGSSHIGFRTVKNLP